MIRNPRAITAASFIAMFFLGVGHSLVGSAARNIGLSPEQIGLLLAVQNIGFGISVAIVGALADTHSKARILCIGSMILALGFFSFYRTPAFGVNILVMALLGIGAGTYEGAADAMLFDLHEKRAAFFINLNHLFVTVGAALIALYLIFLSLEWRGAVVQASVAVAILALVFLVVRLEQRRQGGATLREKVAIIGRSRLMLVLFLATVLTAGVESGAIGMMSTYLAELRGFEQLPAKLGLVVLLAGIAGGRLLVGALARPERIRRMMLALFALSVVAFSLLFLVDLRGLTLPVAFLAGIAMSSQLPLILAYTGLAYRDMAGTVLGAVKIGIPVGGIVIPLLFSAMTGATSFAVALWILPAGLLLGLVLLALPITQPKVTGQMNI